MTEALAVEWAAFNINVNCIAPGAFSSEMMDGMLERMGDITKGFPRQRLGQPAQMDSTLLYLVSPSSECVTGTVIKIDDGQGVEGYYNAEIVPSVRFSLNLQWLKTIVPSVDENTFMLSTRLQVVF